MSVESNISFQFVTNNQSNNGTDDLADGIWTLLNVFLVFSYVCSLTTVYFIVCVALFLRNKTKNQLKKRNRISRNNHSQSRTINGLQNSRKCHKNCALKILTTDHRRTVFGAIQPMHLVLLITLIFNFIRIIIEQLIFFYGGSTDLACDLLTKLIIGFTGIVIHGCLVFLWLRQYVFYTNPLLRKIRPKFLRLTSHTTYAIMVITVLTCLGLHVWWRDYISLDGICRPKLGSQRVSVFVPYGILAASTVTIQLLLTFLFFYPIVCHNKQMNSNKNKNPDQPVNPNSNYTSRSTTQLLQCVRRALYGLTASLVTDICGALVAIWLPEDMPLFVLSVLYEVDIMLNIFCLFYTYIDWREIVFPWRKQNILTS